MTVVNQRMRSLVACGKTGLHDCCACRPEVLSERNSSVCEGMLEIVACSLPAGVWNSLQMEQTKGGDLIQQVWGRRGGRA